MRLELRAEIARERVAHLDRRVAGWLPLAEHVGQVLARVLPAGEVEGHRMILDIGHDIGGEGALALGIHLGGGRAAGPPQVQDAHVGVIMVDQG